MYPKELSRVAIGLVALTAIALVAVPFLFFFSAEAKTSNPWADFGSYVGGVLGPILAALNLVVVLYVAERITGIQQNQLEKKHSSIEDDMEIRGRLAFIQGQVLRNSMIRPAMAPG